MDSSASIDRSLSSCSEAIGSGHGSVRLCIRHPSVELSDVADDCSRHTVAPQKTGAKRAAPKRGTHPEQCRSILTGLLTAVDPAAAERKALLLIEEFGSLAGVLAAPAPAQRLVLDENAVAFLQSIRAAMLHALRAQAFEGPVISTSDTLLSYLRADMAYESIERFRVLFLDTRNRLLKDETLSEGSVKEAPIYPREIMRRALAWGATAIILVHNHPSGDARPSQSDIEATRRIAKTGRDLDVTLHDHVVVARNGATSFRAMGLL